MSKKLNFHRVCVRLLNAGIIALLLAFLVPLSVSAASHASKQPQATCLQAPANLDPTKLSTTQLEVYGLPLRPPSSEGPQAYARWLQQANRIKHDHHNCNPKQLTGSRAHHPTVLPKRQLVQSDITPQTVSGDNAWAGYAAQGSPGTFYYSNAEWNLPCMSTSVRNATASFWVGMGGFGSGNGNTPQAGTDAIVYTNGNIAYDYWVEDNTPGNDYIFTYELDAPCGTQMYVEVDSPAGNGDNVYFAVDGYGANYSFSENWPVTDGSSGECFVEDPPTGYAAFADFNYLAFSNCYINGYGVGGWTHDTLTMLNTSNQAMASAGSLSNGGANFNVNWERAN